MAVAFEEFMVRDDRLTAAKLVWRRYRRHVPGAVEAVYEDNPGLADRGPFIPFGTVVRLAVQPAPESATATPTPRVELW